MEYHPPQLCVEPQADCRLKPRSCCGYGHPGCTHLPMKNTHRPCSLKAVRLFGSSVRSLDGWSLSTVPTFLPGP